MNRFLIKTAQNLGCTWEPVLERRERKREREKEKERTERKRERERERREGDRSVLQLLLIWGNGNKCLLIEPLSGAALQYNLFTSKAARAFQWCRASVIVITGGNLSELQASDHRGEWSVMKWFHIHVQFDSFRTPWHSTANPMVPQIKIKDNTFTWNAPPQPFTSP